MAKYLDSNGLSYFWQKLKQYFSKIGHTHSVSVTAGTAASLTTTSISIPNITKKTVVTGGSKTSIPNVTDVGEAPTLGTAFTIPNVTSVGSAPTLGTAFTIPNVTGAGSAATAAVSQGVLAIVDGTAPTLGTAFTVPNVTNVGSAPTLGTAFTVPNVTDVGSAPTLGTAVEAYTTLTTGDSITVGTATSAKGVDVFTANTPTVVGGTTGASTN